MLAQNTARLSEVAPQIDQPIVRSQKCDVQLRDDGVFVVTRIADIRGAIGSWIWGAWPAGQIVESSLPGGRPSGGFGLPVGLTGPNLILLPSRAAGRS